MSEQSKASSADEELVARSQKGDREAFEELVRRYSRALYARIYLEAGDRHRTEDLVQESVLRAYSSIRQLSDPSGFRVWLHKIAHGVVVDSFRKKASKKRAIPMVEGEAIDRVAGMAKSPQQSAEDAEAREQVLAVLRSLPEDYRGPLTLRYLAGADYETIGRQLGLSNGSLRGLLHRGLELLRRQLGVRVLKEERHETD